MPTWPWHLCLVLSKYIDDDDDDDDDDDCKRYSRLTPKPRPRHVASFLTTFRNFLVGAKPGGRKDRRKREEEHSPILSSPPSSNNAGYGFGQNKNLTCFCFTVSCAVAR